MKLDRPDESIPDDPDQRKNFADSIYEEYALTKPDVMVVWAGKFFHAADYSDSLRFYEAAIRKYPNCIYDQNWPFYAADLVLDKKTINGWAEFDRMMVAVKAGSGRFGTGRGLLDLGSALQEAKVALMPRLRMYPSEYSKMTNIIFQVDAFEMQRIER